MFFFIVKKTPPIPANGKPSGQCEIGPLGAGHYIFKIRSDWF